MSCKAGQCPKDRGVGRAVFSGGWAHAEECVGVLVLLLGGVVCIAFAVHGTPVWKIVGNMAGAVVERVRAKVACALSARAAHPPLPAERAAQGGRGRRAGRR